MKKLEKIFWYLLGFFVIYVLVGFKLISYIAQDQIIKNIEENLTAKAKINRLEFNPFIFKVKIDGFDLYDENKSYVNIKNIILDIELFNSINNKTIFVNDVLINKLNLNIAQNKNDFDLLKLIKDKNQDTNTKKTNDNSEFDIKFLVKSFIIKNSNIYFIKDNNYKISLTKINNQLQNLGNTQKVATNYLSFNIDKSSEIKTKTMILNSEFKDFEVMSNIDLKNINLKKLSDYKKEVLNDINIKSINLNSNVNIDFKTKDESLVVKTKNTILSDIKVSKSNNLDFNAKKLALESVVFNLKNNTLDVKNISLDSSNFRLDENIKFQANELLVNSSNINLNKNSIKVGDIALNKAFASYIHLKNQNKESNKNTSKEDSSFVILTNEIKINNSNLDFEDRTIKVPFKINIKDLNGFVSNINTKENIVSDLKVNGVINKYATANIDAKVNLNNVKILSDIAFRIKNLNINDFTPYSREFIAQDIDEGKLDVNLKYNIENSNLDAKNNVVVKQIKLGKTYEIQGVETLPLGIAIALLEDSNDVIEINLPVTGNLDDPEFSIAPIVWKAFTNLIFKAVTAPFSLLGAIFNFADDEINKVTFEFNKTQIGPIQKEPLDKLVKILSNRPNMALEFSNKYNLELEKNTIVEKKYKDFIKTKKENIALKDFLLLEYKKLNDKEKTKKLLKEFDKKEEEFLNFLIKFTKENIKITKNDYEQIALKRGKNIKSYLINNGVKENQVIVDEEIIEETLQKDSIIIEFKVNSL